MFIKLFFSLGLVVTSITFADRSETGTPRVMQGPMLGAGTPASQKIWLRFSGPFEGRVVCSMDIPGSETFTVPLVETGDPEEFARVAELLELKPDTRYAYRIEIAGREDRYLEQLPSFHFRTAPVNPDRFRFAFGSCARFVEDRAQPIWKVVLEADPCFFLWLGDNIYGDSLIPEILSQEYRRQRDVASLQPVLRGIPQMAIWDDHDFGLNDHDRTNPVAEQALALFKSYWANPDTPAGTKGNYYRFHFGGMDFFCLDNRSFRDPYFVPDGPGKTQLGHEQLEWLKEELRRSDSPFKFLVSGGGWTRMKGPDGDSWASFLHERDALFDWIRDEGINGVVLLSGDTHRGEVNVIRWSQTGGYDFHEFASSPLAQEPSRKTGPSKIHPFPEEAALIPAYNRGVNIGLITVDAAGEDSVLRFDLLNRLGQKAVDTVVLHARHLKNPTGKEN